MTRRFLVVYENGSGNLSGFAPDVPGCASTGHTLEEMRQNLREAVEFHLEGLSEDGEPIPATTTRVVAIPEGGFANGSMCSFLSKRQSPPDFVGAEQWILELCRHKVLPTFAFSLNPFSIAR